MKKEHMVSINKFTLWRGGAFYFIELPNGDTMVNLSGSKEELIEELERWKREVDYNNKFMLDIEDKFIKFLEIA